jgi:hypothetical protein
MTSVPEEKEKGTKHECKTEQKSISVLPRFLFSMWFPFANPRMMLSRIACGSMWVGLCRLETAKSDAEREKQGFLMHLRWKGSNVILQEPK